jgi:SET domain-containing protein
MNVVSPEPKTPELVIKPSKIHGLGLFIADDIQQDTVIYESHEYTLTSYPIYGSLQKTPHEHLLEPFLRWQNHSCRPNSRLYFSGSNVGLIALMFIAAGSELVCDYRETEDYIPVPFRCNCGFCDHIMIE